MKIIATVFLALAALPAMAATVGVMADDQTGEVFPAAVETKFQMLAVHSVETNFTGFGTVEVPGIVQAVYSDSEANHTDAIRLDTNFPTSRIEWENWARNASGTTYTSNTMIIGNGSVDYDKLEAGVAIVTRSNGVLWADSVEVRTNPPAASIDFHPALPEQEMVAIDAIRPVVLDQYGLHYGNGTGEASGFAQRLASPSGNYPALATADGVSLFYSYSGSRVWYSPDRGESWTQLTSAPSGDWPALATADGVSLFYSYAYGGVWYSFPKFGSHATAPYTVCLTATPTNALKIKDFASSKSGTGVVYWSLEIGPDEWGIWGSREYPLQWRTIAKKENGTWYARTTTNGLEATSAPDAPSAITIALASNELNRITAGTYSPIYGYDAFTPGRPVKWACTFFPDASGVTNNAPGISGIYTLTSRFADTFHWATDDFRTDLVSTNPAASTVTWPEDYAARAAIFYHPKREEEE